MATLGVAGCYSFARSHAFAFGTPQERDALRARTTKSSEAERALQQKEELIAKLIEEGLRATPCT